MPNDKVLTGGLLEVEENALPDSRNRERMCLGYVEMAGINLTLARESAREDFFWGNMIEYSNNN